MSDASDRLINAMDALEALAEELAPDDAYEAIDDATLQAFWRDWPEVSKWAGGLWRRLNADLEQPAQRHADPELDEVGGSG